MKKIFLVCMAFAVVFSVTAQTTLKLNPEKNKVYRFKSVSDQDISQTVNGMQQNTNAVSTTYMSLKTLEITPEFLVMEVHFDSILSETSAMGKNITINSNKEGKMASEEGADVMTAVMNRLSKNALYVKMEYNGKVREIVNFSMLSGMIMKDTASITGTTAAALKQQVKNTVNHDAIKLMIENFTYNLPAREVKKGETWNFSSPINSGGMELEVKSDYTLEELKGNDAVVSTESSIKPIVNAKPMNYGGANITYDNLSGLGKSTLTLETQTGFVKTAVSKMHITGDLSVSVQGMNMQIPMIIDSQTNVTAL